MPWIPVDGRNGYQTWGPQGGPRYPKAALRDARAHMLGDTGDVLNANPDDFWVERFCERDPSVGVIACYTCLEGLEGQGSGVLFEATYSWCQ